MKFSFSIRTAQTAGTLLQISKYPRASPHNQPATLSRRPRMRGEIPKEVARKMKNLQELAKLKDSISYLYVEHAIIEQDDAAIIAIQKWTDAHSDRCNDMSVISSGDQSDPCSNPGDLRKRMYGNLVRRTRGTLLCGGVGETRSAKNLLV